MNKPTIKQFLSGFAVLSFATLAHAQNAAPTDANKVLMPPTSATSVNKTEAPVVVTPEMRAVIKELLDLTKFRDSVRSTYQGMAQSLPQQMAQSLNVSVQQNQKLTEDQKKQVLGRLKQSFEGAAKEAIEVFQDPKIIDDVVQNSYAIYAKYFTVAEIKQILAFYKTPTGGKVITVMPQVINDSMRSSISLVQPRILAITNKVLNKEVEAVQNAK